MYIYNICISAKVPWSGPQNEHFNYTMCSITLYNKPYIYIHL